MRPLPLALALALPALAGCTTATPIRGADGSREILIACGAATPIANCYRRAERECPAGYALISEHRGFNRAEIRVRCEAE